MATSKKKAVKSSAHRRAAIAERKAKEEAVATRPPWMNGDKSGLPMKPPGKEPTS